MIGERELQNVNGFTLMEVIFALSLFALTMSALFPAFLDHVRFNTFSEVRSGSYQAAQVVLDKLRIEDPASMPSSGSDSEQNVSIGSRLYAVTVSYCEEVAFCAAEIKGF